jgi:hypothetical protein
MYTQSEIKRSEKASWLLTVIAMGLMLTYIVDAALERVSSDLLLLVEKDRAAIFGTTPIILFFAAFGIGLKSQSRITGVLLIAGGAIMSKAVLAAMIISGGNLSAATQTFIGIVVVGYIIMGLGIYQIIIRQKYSPQA